MNSALKAMQADYDLDPEAFKRAAIGLLLPASVYSTALAARGDPPFDKPQRWACLAGLRAAGLLGMGIEVNVALLIAERVGSKDPAEAERLIASATRARQANPEDAERLAKAILRERIKADPFYARRLMQELFGVIEVPTLGGSGSHLSLPHAASNGVSGPNGHTTPSPTNGEAPE